MVTKTNISFKGTKNRQKYIDFSRPQTDQETVLVDSEYIKTKIPKMRGASIFRHKKSGRYYHRDTLHVGQSSHLEVYNSRGEHIGKADINTGELIENTADKTKRKLNL